MAGDVAPSTLLHTCAVPGLRQTKRSPRKSLAPRRTSRYLAEVNFARRVQLQLEQLERSHLLRTPRVVAGRQDPVVVVDGKSAINLCSNNYLGLASHPALANAIVASLPELGCGAGASRHVSGSEQHHALAESRLALHVKREAALLFGSGYAANVGTLQALLGPNDVVFSDAYNHASLIDGMRLSRARVHVYPHRDLSALAALLKEHRAGAEMAMVVSDAVFSMDGDQADLIGLQALCNQYDTALMIDEAHSLGVFGPCGAGLCAEQGVAPEILIGTLGKAFGVAGAFLAGDAATVRLVENRARSYVFSTAPPAFLAAAVLAACDLVEAADDRRVQLRERVTQLRAGLLQLGYRVLATETPVVPVLIGEPLRTMELSAALWERGVFAHGIRPPTVPPGTSRLRLTAMATHSAEQIDEALAAFAALRDRW